MGFYEQISRYYDYIFPTGERQLSFLKDAAGPAPCSILDVACGTGGYSIALAKAGYDMTAVDIDAEMVERAKDKAAEEGLEIKAFRCDMLDLERQFHSQFHSIFCIGNSIVHLGSLEDIRAALLQMTRLLCKGGSLALQIINYDRIIKYGINELPAIKDEAAGIEFVRKYEYIREKGIINFNTSLSVNTENENKVYNNSIELLPVLSTDIMRILEDLGFAKTDFYGDFSYSPFAENSFMLVVKALRNR